MGKNIQITQGELTMGPLPSGVEAYDVNKDGKTDFVFVENGSIPKTSSSGFFRIRPLALWNEVAHR